MQTLRLVDSHCHLNRLDLDAFSGSLELALKAASQAGVEHFLTVSVEREDALLLKNLAQLHPCVSYSVGWHPTSVRDEPLYDWLIDLGQDQQCIALGETGLDFYHQEEGQTVEMQIQAFREHIQAAKFLGKPLIIHTRQSAFETLQVLREENADEIGGVMHCFTENWDIAQQALDLGFMISLSGIVSFKNAHIVHEVAQKTPLDRLLIETDAPYLAPSPYRGKPNHPAWVKYVAQAIADLRGISIEELGQATSENFYRYFKVKPHG
jgi:TatD DNase family protein